MAGLVRENWRLSSPRRPRIGERGPPPGGVWGGSPRRLVARFCAVRRVRAPCSRPCQTPPATAGPLSPHRRDAQVVGAARGAEGHAGDDDDAFARAGESFDVDVTALHLVLSALLSSLICTH